MGEIEPGLDPFTAVCCELPTPRGFIDNLLMTARGDIAIVETKLFRNPEARRQVVAQALDYATSLFSMTYIEFEAAVLKGAFQSTPKPSSRYEALPESERLSEAAFVDAVSLNLNRGRALVLVVGDGIRREAEALLTSLNAHARFGFTLALIELGVFRMPEPDERFLVRPRTLAKTAIVSRTIVEITGSGTVQATAEQHLARPETLSSEAFWEALNRNVPGARPRVENILQNVEQLGVHPEFHRSLMLKWQRPDGGTVNVGYIFPTDGAINFDMMGPTVPQDLKEAYLRDLAELWGCDVRKMATSGNFSLQRNGKAVKLPTIIDALDQWPQAIQRFIAAITDRDSQ